MKMKKVRSAINQFKFQPASLTFILFILILISLSLGQLGRFNLPLGATYPHDWLIAIFLLISGVEVLKNKSDIYYLKLKIKKIKFSFSPEIIAFLWLIFNLAYQVFIQANSFSLIYDSRILYYSLFIIALTRQSNLWKKYLKLPLYPWFFAVVSFITLFGFVQYKFFYDLRVLFFLGWDNHLGRLVSTMLDPNFAGFLIALGLIYWQALKHKYKLRPVVYWLSSFSLILALALTFSRASYLSAFVGLGLLIFFSKQRSAKILNSILIGLLLLTIGLVPKPKSEGGNLWRTASIKARITSDTLSFVPPLSTLAKQLTGEATHSKIIITRSQPVAFPSSFTSHANQPNNLEVFIYHQTGLIGLGLLLILLFKWLKFVYRQNRLRFIFLIMLLVHAQFNNTAFEPFVFLIFWGMFSETLRLKLDI